MTSETFPIVDCAERIDVQPAPPALGDVLRHATAEAHTRSDHHPGFSAVQDATLGYTAYAALLSRVYCFNRPFEAAAQIKPERTLWLELDLAALGLDAATRGKLARCTAFQARLSPDYVLGARYVVEGSSLGGRGIARQFDALLGKGVSGGRRFFNGHGSETGDV